MLKVRLSGTTALALLTAGAVVLATGTGAYLYTVRHAASLLQNARDTSRAQAELIRAGLEYSMQRDDRDLIQQMVESFGSQANTERVALLDREGALVYSSTPAAAPDEFSVNSDTCMACHKLPAAERMDSRVIDTSGGRVLRTVVPIRNKPACHECHDPEDRINGVLMFDFNVEAVRAGMDRDLRWMVAATALCTLVMIAGVVQVVRLVVLRRLRRFETTARAIANGDLGQRVPATGTDTISWLAREFNSMADSMSGLISRVNGQQQRLENVINSIDDGIIVLDAHQTVVAANDAFLERTGRSRHAVLGCGCRDIGVSGCNPDDCPTLACARTAQPQVRLCERHAADGSIRWEEVHASPILSSSGEVAQVVEVWRDISGRRAAEAQLAESHRLASLGMLASGFSHELNTPLGTVLMCVEGILRETHRAEQASGDDSLIGQRAEVARTQLMRCREITQHFLRLSRGQTLTAAIIDLRDSVSTAAQLVLPTAQASGISVVVAPALGGCTVRSDEAELQHALINLLLNAIQASPRGSEVRVEIMSGDPARVRIIDHGSGVASADQARIFEPFVSLRDGGTGLGLFLSKNFMQRWGGSITVQSEPGAGATFELTLPAAALPAEQRRYA